MVMDPDMTLRATHDGGTLVQAGEPAGCGDGLLALGLRDKSQAGAFPQEGTVVVVNGTLVSNLLWVIDYPPQTTLRI